jgi:hypothetical protein
MKKHKQYTSIDLSVWGTSELIEHIGELYAYINQHKPYTKDDLRTDTEYLQGFGMDEKTAKDFIKALLKRGKQ